MSNIPFVDTEADGQNLTQRARGLIPWLPDPHECPYCGVFCVTGVGYDPLQAAFHGGQSPVWRCRECGREYRREEGSPLSANMW